MDEPEGHYAKQHKPDIKGQKLCDSTSMRYLKQSDSETENRSSCRGKGRGVGVSV